ncbi:MAG: putative deoxyribonuclease TATDN1-like [Elusimicrobia bacterium]|nr:MAG: putative deoxyribonuclease TATDN1-like [Elusimicrobiota bacterium]KAF0157650.1 MAG: putative deoxyribonuclease TATDN1-like [Elusimicrobiota bacterium]
MPLLFDAHNHFQEFPDPAAAAAGLRPAVCCATGPADWEEVRSLAEAVPGVVPFFGVHPWSVAEAGRDWLAPLGQLLRDTRSGVGECGLDALKAPPLAEQAEAFKRQVELAVLLDRPLAVHCVRVWGPLLDILRASRPLRFLVHSYSGSADMTRELAALGGYFSFGPGIMDEKRVKARAALAEVPRDRLLFESEAPQGADSPAELLARAHAAAEKMLGLPAGSAAEISARNGAEFLGSLAEGR